MAVLQRRPAKGTLRGAPLLGALGGAPLLGAPREAPRFSASRRAPRFSASRRAPRFSALRRAVVAVACVITAVGAAGLPSPATASPANPDRLDVFVERQMTRAHIPGVAYAVVEPDGVAHQGTFGVDGDGDDVAPDTPFLWGSVAKPVAATLLVLMAGAGEVDLDAPVIAYLPEFRTADKDASNRITVRHLLSHTSGLPERMDLTDSYDADRRPADVLPLLTDLDLVAGVGTTHQYSSLNYLVLGALVERVTDRPYAEVLTERVLKPAGMDTALTSAAAVAEGLPPGHRYVLGQPQPFDTDFDPAGVSYGYLGGSLRDAIGFARANLSGSDLLSAAQQKQLRRPQVRTDTGRGYGLGWRTWRVFNGDTSMTWHSGAAPGFQASVVLLPDQDRAIVVLQNAYGSFQENQLLDTAWGLTSLLDDADPELHPIDSRYTVMLAVLGVLCLLLIGLVGWSIRRAVTGHRPRSRGHAVVGLAGWWVPLGLLAAGLLALPGGFGVTRTQVMLWAPDIAILIHIGLVLALGLALLRVAVTARGLRGR